MKAGLKFHPIDALLLAVPVAFALRYVPGWRNETALFVVSALGIIPLAGWMGQATEQLAERTGAGVGALLNATFGNAAELIISLVALSHGLIGVVKASITGSIIGNILLVLGASFLAGGIKHPTLKFNQTAARSAAASLSIAAIALVIPSVFHFSASHSATGWSPHAEQRLSLAIAAVLALTYLCWLGFSLLTHRELFQERLRKEGDPGHPAVAGWPLTTAIGVLAGATVLIAFMSEFLVGSIESARGSMGLTETFVGVIIVAIIGNAAEHSTAVTLAWKNKVELSLGIAIGSSLQIALFVTPVLVFCSYFLGQPMNLEFSLPEIAAVGLAVWIVGLISGDGEANWFEGLQLISVYLVIAILFYFLPATH